MVIEDESRDQDVTKDGDNSIITEEQDLSKTRNTTSVEDKANDSKQKYISDGNENIESEDAGIIFNLNVLYNVEKLENSPNSSIAGKRQQRSSKHQVKKTFKKKKEL